MHPILQKVSIKKIIFLLITTIIIFIVLFQTIPQTDNLKDIITNIKTVYLWWILLISSTTIFFNGIRWHLLMKMAGYNISLRKATSITTAAWALIIIPGRLGDLARAYPLRDKIPIKVSFGAVFLEKIIDIIVLLLLSSLGLLLIQKTILSAGLFIIAILAILGIEFLYQIHNKLPPKYSQKMEELWQIMKQIKNYKKTFLYIVITSILNWLRVILIAWLSYQALGVAIDFVINLAYFPLAIFIGIIPISIAGVGTRDSALVFLMTGYALSAVSLWVGIIYSLSSYFLLSLIGLPFFIREFKKSS